MQPLPPTPSLRIGQAARLSGVSEANIRFYEEKSLLAASGRSESSYRLYSDSDVHVLRFIRLCRSMDMSLDEVRSLLGLSLSDKADCTRAAETLDAHLGHVRERLKELRQLEKDLKHLRTRCDGLGDTCHIMEALHQMADRTDQAQGARVAMRHV